ncbi:outer membrane protein assembly factor BamB family protein [Actinoplanes derwentensis]|uniref:PQQ-like domain-containing protein n=1 Tax=Actinoplanes derwentensis TaxID=113562 RepID=A0A1H2D6K5_9ACTN|nr:PQQ-binding-like beta-propeller repeat protein [Actinoplanes derwentensis]GID85665.1 hypothetical protein Ade03nite_45890 [Actinoplanes derwentensis]SDT78092.1 hypothetical protein SAMN04489716_8227 [Actinoplanes derwentensis]
MREAVIELGEVPSAGSGEPDPVRPRGSLPYRWVVAPLAVALTVALGGAGPPPRPPPEPLTLSVTLSDSVRVAGGRVHVIGPGEKAEGRPRSRRLMRYPIRSYRLPDLAPLDTWTTVVDGDISYVGDGLGDILLYSYQGNFAGGNAVAAVRPGSAEPVWERHAFLYGVSADRGTVLAFEDTTEDPFQQDWVGLDSRTGAIRWQVRHPTGGHLTLRGAGDLAAYPSRIYTLRPDGLIEAWDTADGTLAGSLRTTVAVDHDTRFWSAGGLLLVGHPRTGTIAYGDGDLGERWRLGAPGLEENTFPYACGVVICLTGRPGGLAAIDPASGRELWRSDFWEFTQPVGDRLLVGSSDLTEPELSVLDPVTGRVVAEAGSWSSGGPGPEPGTAWVYRIQTPGYRLRYGILDLATGTVRTLGSAERIAGDCVFASGALICRRLDSSVGVWRL